MQKIIIVGRPYSNGGDYLIYDRLFQALQTFYPQVQITMKLKPQEELTISELNTYDAVITGGGGAQFSEQYVRTSFLYMHFHELTVPVHYTGTGLYGADGSATTVYEYRYSDELKRYFRQVTERGGQLGTRDWIVDTIFKNNGIENTIMTGCPAWYDMERLQQPHEDPIGWEAPFRSVKKIAVSNHGLTKNAEDHGKKLEQMQSLLRFLQHRYPHAQIVLTFNDGYQTKYSSNYNLSLKELAEGMGAQCVELSNDAAKFHAMDEVDMHIGFRVHTHIYCLSRKIPSLLIEEDIRGYGMNETFHLPHITAYLCGSEPDHFQENPYLLKQLQVVLEQGAERIRYDEVSQIIEQYYQTGMKRWLCNILP